MRTGKLMSIVVVISFLSMGSLLMIPEGNGSPTRAGGSEEGKTLWEAETPFKGTAAIDGVAMGDADTARAGNELVWVSRDQKVYLGQYDNSGSFSYQDIWDSGGQQLTPAIGNLRDDLPGNEILVVGLSSGTEDVDPGDGQGPPAGDRGLQARDRRPVAGG